MSPTFRYDRFQPSDTGAHDALMRQAFASQAERNAVHRETFGPDEIRLIRAGDEVAAALTLIPMGQWYGGRPVPCVGIGGLTVAPPFRGRGASTFMLAEMFGEAKARGLPLATLYASTVPVYRKAGFEVAGRWTIYAADTGRLVAGKPSTPALRRIGAADRPVLESLKARESRDAAGVAERSAALWRRKLEPFDRVVDGYLVEGPTGPEGYMIVAREQPKQLKLLDWCATTGAAARQILAALAGDRSIFPEVVWPGAPVDMLAAHMPDKGLRVRESEEWLTRIVDVEAALAARGYPAGLATEIAFAVEDPLLPWNRDRFVLRIANGRGTASRGDGSAPTLALDVRALAPLYTGHYTPAFLARAGRVQGPAEALDAAALAFAGPAPWMIDHF